MLVDARGISLVSLDEIHSDGDEDTDRNLLEFLADRVVELEDGLSSPAVTEAERLRSELDMTSGVIDRVLYVYHGLEQGDVEQLEGAEASA